MIDSENRIIHFSEDWVVLFVSPNEGFYEDLMPLFKQYGVAFSVLDAKSIIIDFEQIKDLTDDHVYAIEAHELAHYIANHFGRDDKKDEIEADRIAIDILQLNGYNKAAEFLIDRIEENGLNYKDMGISNNIKDALRQYIK
jgi:hypothetical protein